MNRFIAIGKPVTTSVVSPCYHGSATLRFHLNGVVRKYSSSGCPPSPLPAEKSQNNTSSQAPLRVPGHGLPVDFEVFDGIGPHTEISGFSHGFSQWIQDRRNTIKELAMIRIMDHLTDKLDWDRKVFDEKVMLKWKLEAMRDSRGLITEMTWEWMVKELQWKAQHHAERGFTTTLETGTAIVKADEAYIKENVREELKEAVQSLLGTNDVEKDWHPGSERVVLNLVHPSLYPFVYGLTHVLTDTTVGLNDYFTSLGQKAITLSANADDIDDQGLRANTLGSQIFSNRNRWSTRFQWLPCEVSFIKDKGDDVRITSYINNLHPNKHRAMYKAIEKVISKSIQPWNEILGKYQQHYRPARIWHNEEIKQFPGEPEWINEPEFLDENLECFEENLKLVEEYLCLPNSPCYIPPEHDEYAGYSYNSQRESFSWEGEWWKHPELDTAIYEKWARVRTTEHPEPNLSTFDDWKTTEWSDRYSRQTTTKTRRKSVADIFRTAGLQVIIKLSSIELTPEDPQYNGGNWHLEGKLNEHIVATSIYYFDTENITDSRIRFRQEAQLDMMDIEYDASNHGPVEDVYSVRNLHDCSGVQVIGSVVTKQGRLLVFPNTLQHCVEPFGLKDKTKKGHRRFLVVWLVDPHYRVLSTRNVPPQQADWWDDAGRTQEMLESSAKSAGQAQMQNAGTAGAGAGGDKSWCMSREKAELFRLELMAERTNVMKSVEGSYENYNFCEH